MAKRKRRLPPRDKLRRFKKKSKVTRKKPPRRRKPVPKPRRPRRGPRRRPVPLPRPRLPLEEQARVLGTTPEALKLAKERARKQRRTVTDIDIARAERDIVIERERTREQNALRLVQAALDDGLGPHDVGPTGRDLYIEIAMQTGIPEREIYTLFRSPEQFGLAA